jgi:hypothetical protein
MSKINTTLGIFILAGVSILAGIVCWAGIQLAATEETASSLETQKASQAALEEIIEGRVLYVIDNGEGQVQDYQIVPSADSTVFSLLKELAHKENFEVESKVYEGMGVFVESIAGVKNGTNNKYWQYWVNDELPMVAADKKEIKGGDKIEWKFVPAEF